MSPVHKYCQDWVTVCCSMSPVHKYCTNWASRHKWATRHKLSNTAQTVQHGSNWATNKRCGKRMVHRAMACAFICQKMTQDDKGLEWQKKDDVIYKQPIISQLIFRILSSRFMQRSGLELHILKCFILTSTTTTSTSYYKYPTANKSFSFEPVDISKISLFWFNFKC